ncbi:Receptor-like protein kinase [Cocos nucifera]|uniref:Receptor-like protein kinase n=1 Tax=Cocos nucifera TaxID=13894 RepID=A0A8K0IAI2_COCNU|nr:Receptor-like protein kinase [Cocos nucifera]
MSTSLPGHQTSLRSFPTGERNCYALKSLVQGQKYLLRATFMYGNYDGQHGARANEPIQFDLHIGVNRWKTIKIFDASAIITTEAITVALADYISVCLINKQSGTPFISSLELRPLKTSIYPAANASMSLVLFTRVNMGPTDGLVRYPDDRHDRIWEPFNYSSRLKRISTSSTVHSREDDVFEAPSAVLQTALTPGNVSEMGFHWDTKREDIRPEYHIFTHFAEILSLGPNDSRTFDIYLNGKSFWDSYTAHYLISGYVYTTVPYTEYDYSLSFKATNNSTLPPIINGLEIYAVMHLPELSTDSGDDFAMDPSEGPRGEDYTERKVDCKDDQLKLESRQFTYKDLENITNKFVRIIGKGGFGIVYHGFLENGVEVAVKLCSRSSSQGTKEFLAEAQSLTRVHHKNLVTFVGYCKDVNYLALIYEYMSQGSLQEHLRGKAGLGRILSWGERLQIAVEAAQGLAYLHKGCTPPIIHRDVKTSNILLGEELVAKIADFGLSKSFHSDAHTHVSTEMVAGTPGYVDPEYHNSYQLNEKSDVYSFGVVLLELITSHPPIMPGPGKAHIVQRVASKVARGNIEDAVDARLQGAYDANSVWKIVDLAMKCTAQFSTQRPTMSDVVIQLKESLALEAARERSESLHNEGLDVSQNGAFELDRNKSMPVGPSAR